MWYAQQQLAEALRHDGWQIRWRQPLGEGSSLTWWVERTGHRWPPGRVVLIDFRHRPFDPEARFQVLVRPPMSPAGAIVEAVFAPDEGYGLNLEPILQAVDFFRDPRSWVEKAYPSWEWKAPVWEPPTEWLDLPWQPALGGDVLWARWGDPGAMLDLVLPVLTPRKSALLGCAISRKLPLSMLRDANVAAVESAERYADGLCPRREMKKACKHSGLPWLANLDPPDAARAAVTVLRTETSGADALASDAIRELVSNPFRPVELRHEWLRNNGRAAAQLATHIDREGRYDDMPILADALEDAGCTVQTMLDHCRIGGPHLRGCWVIDLLCGRPERIEKGWL